MVHLDNVLNWLVREFESDFRFTDSPELLIPKRELEHAALTLQTLYHQVRWGHQVQ